jgi:hypothetical protein
MFPMFNVTIFSLLFLFRRNQKFQEELIAYFPLIRHRSNRKLRVQQFFCFCLFVAAVTFLPTLPSNDRGIHIQTYRLMGGIYEACRWDELRCHDIHNKFHKNWLKPSNLLGEIHRNTDSNCDLISLLLFFQNKETRRRRKKKNRWLVLPRTSCFFLWVLTPCK